MTAMIDVRTQGGFARDFDIASGQRVMVAALTHQQFVDLAAAFAGTSVPWTLLHNLRTQGTRSPRGNPWPAPWFPRSS